MSTVAGCGRIAPEALDAAVPDVTASEVYVSTDVETDSPIPGVNPMLSLASAAFLPDETIVSTFSANLHPLEGAEAHPETMAFGSTQPEAWAAVVKGRESPAEVMGRYCDWVKGLTGKPVFVAYPVGFDFTFVYWYLHRFTGESPFAHSALDMKTLAMAILGTPYRGNSKRAWPRRWFPDGVTHTHIALDDAIEQGIEFCRMLAEARNRTLP